MQIDQLVIEGFRCFGPEATIVDFEKLTCLIGANGSGKTTVLLAVARMFGVEASDRRVLPSDFRLETGEFLADEETRSLRLEAWFKLPELRSGNEHLDAVAATFEQMVVVSPGGEPRVRIELRATWTNDRSFEGDVDSSMWWIKTASEDAEEIEKARLKLMASDRALIRALYVPAVRDPAAEVRAIAGTGLARLLHAAIWSDELRELVENHAEEAAECLSNEGSIALLNKLLGARWAELYQGSRHARSALEPPLAELQDLVRGLKPTFARDSEGDRYDVRSLSDGFRSLFSLAFTSALLDAEDAVRGIARSSDAGFDLEKLRLPLLTFLLVEEPENHVSPHHLGRVVELLRTTCRRESCQAVITSHSPALLRRIEPSEVRYCKGSERDERATVLRITLPSDRDDAFKYVREGVRGHPEIYFSRVVVLGEGASEEIVLTRLMASMGHPLDRDQVAIVPLGGRHVQHLWRLLRDLGIEHLTLLDLDRERLGGAWGRVHYVITQLLEHGVGRESLLEVEQDGVADVLSDEDVAEIPNWDIADKELLRGWLESLEEYGVFFSKPLDLDLAMLKAFPEIYKQVARAGPRIPKDESKKEEYHRAVARAVLGDEEDVGHTYGDSYLELFPWYRLLFIHSSKLATHSATLAEIGDDELSQKAPPTLRRLVKRCRSIITT